MFTFFKKFLHKRSSEVQLDSHPFAVLAETLVEQTPSRISVLEHQITDLHLKYIKLSTLLGRVLHGYMKTENIRSTEQAIACLEAYPPDTDLQKIIIDDLEKMVFYEQHSIET